MKKKERKKERKKESKNETKKKHLLVANSPLHRPRDREAQ